MFLLCRKFYGIKNTFSKEVMLINLIIWYFYILLFCYGREILKFIVKNIYLCVIQVKNIF